MAIDLSVLVDPTAPVAIPVPSRPLSASAAVLGVDEPSVRISRGLFVNHVEAAVRVVLSGDAGAAGVTGVRVRISLDAKRAFPVPPAFDAGSWGWTFLGAGLHGDRRVFDFVYAGALVAPGGLTTELGIHFSGWWAPGRPQDMTFQAFGVRDAATVESSPVTAGA